MVSGQRVRTVKGTVRSKVQFQSTGLSRDDPTELVQYFVYVVDVATFFSDMLYRCIHCVTVKLFK